MVCYIKANIKMKKIFLLSVLTLIIGYILGQSKYHVEYDESEICQLTVNDERIYQLLDTFCELEKLQPYYMDTNFSLHITIYFESDSNYAEFGNVFFAMIKFEETVPIVGAFNIGFFLYKNTNVFVTILQTHWSEYKDILPIDPNSRLADYPVVNRLMEFPEQFHEFNINCNKTKVFYSPRDLYFEDGMNWEEKYNTNKIWFTHDKNGFHFYGYNTRE